MNALNERRSDAYARIAEACTVLSMPAPSRVAAYPQGVLTLDFDNRREADQWTAHLCLTDDRHMWQGWTTYVNSDRAGGA